MTCSDAMVEIGQNIMNSTYLNGLHPGRSLDQRKKIVDQLFFDMKQIVESDVTKYTTAWEYYLIESKNPSEIPPGCSRFSVFYLNLIIFKARPFILVQV